MKLPQILAIVSAGFVTGIARSSVYLELLCGMWNLAFNYLSGFPFSTYGESAFIAIQNVFLIILLWVYAQKGDKPSSGEVVGVVLGLAAAAAGLGNGGRQRQRRRPAAARPGKRPHGPRR